MAHHRRGLVWASALALLGCEPSAGGAAGTGSGGATVALDSFPAALTSAMCAALAKCQHWQWHTLTPTGCAAALNISEPLAVTVASVKAGKSTYDAAKAAQCLTAIASTCLTDQENKPAPCTELFRGTLSDGAACLGADECTSGYCKKDAQAPCGVCTPTVPSGGKCDAGPCSPGHTCRDGGCAPLGSVAAGGPCQSSADCAAGLFCDALGKPAVCTARRATGGACGANGDCVAGLVCLPAASSGKGPGACGAPLAVGQPCKKVTSSVAKEVCAPGSNCCVPTTATKSTALDDAKCLPLLELGQACASHMQCGIDGECKDGKCALLPAKVGDLCAPPPFPGAPSTGKRCGAGLTCRGDGKCAAAAKLGEPCSGPTDCASDLACSFKGVCFAPSGAGGPCSDKAGEFCAGGVACGADGKCPAPPVCT